MNDALQFPDWSAISVIREQWSGTHWLFTITDAVEFDLRDMENIVAAGCA